MKFNLTKEDVLNKAFVPSYKGYDPNEVDEFLDLVLKDYSLFEEYFKKNDKTLSALRKENEDLKQNLEDLKHINQESVRSSLKNKNELNTSKLEFTHSKFDNLELLKRCALYEKKLYSLGVDPSKLK